MQGGQQMTCPTCNGSGQVYNSQTGRQSNCPTCGGTGKIAVTLADLPFWYPVNVTLTALQANLAASITVDNDADFEWRWIVAASTGIFSVELTDRFTSRPLNTPGVPIFGENIAGTAQLPFILPKPYLIRRTSTIALKFTDRSGAGNTVQFALIGYKIS